MVVRLDFVKGDLDLFGGERNHIGLAEEGSEMWASVPETPRPRGGWCPLEIPGRMRSAMTRYDGQTKGN
jgi:hypothetical protein